MLKNLPIRKKLIMIIMLASCLTLILATSGLMIYDLLTYRSGITNDLKFKARIIGASAATALKYENSNNIHDIITGVAKDPQIVCAAVFSAEGASLGSFGWDQSFGSKLSFRLAKESRTQVRDTPTRIWIQEPITYGGETIGSIIVAADSATWYKRAQAYGQIGLLILVACSAVSFLLASLLQGVITRPILALASTMEKVWRRTPTPFALKKPAETKSE